MKRGKQKRGRDIKKGSVTMIRKQIMNGFHGKTQIMLKDQENMNDR